MHKNLKGKIDDFEKTIDLMSSIKYYNLAAKEFYGEKDVVSYFLKRLHEFKPK